MTIVEWLRSLRRNQPATSVEIRRDLHALKQQHAVTARQRDLLALDAVDQETAAAQWRHLDQTAREVHQRMQVLTAALPLAEAREAEAARQARERARQERMRDFERQRAEVQEFIDAVLGSLPSGEVLTKARDLRDALCTEAAELREWSNDAHVRRPLDPLHAIHDALDLRLRRIERSRWIGASPITLNEKRAS